MVVVIVALVAVIAVLLVERVAHAYVESRDRRHLVNALVARDARELAGIERTDRPTQLRKVAGDERPRLPEGL